jgi:hypothetical protein
VKPSKPAPAQRVLSQVEAVVCTTLTARSEPYNRKAIHASRLNQAQMRIGIEIAESDVAARNHGSQRRHRWRYRIATGKANVFGFCSEAPSFVPERKTRSLWLPARVIAVSAVSRCRTPLWCGTRTVSFQVNDVAARDVQAATSPASRIAPARPKSWRFAGGGSRAEGKSRRGEGQVFGWRSVVNRPCKTA